MMLKRGFTLIELLIVVAIIAILAAIAVPNFLEAQMRSKVARAKNDLRSTSLAIESYLIDYNTVPPDGNDVGGWPGYVTPLAENPGLIPDCMPNTDGQTWGNGQTYGLRNRLFIVWRQFTTPVAYMSTIPLDPFSNRIPLGYETWVAPTGPRKPVFCLNTSWGPDRVMQSAYNFPNCIYDPSNGTVSPGDMFRIGALKDADYARNRFGPSFDFMPH